MKEKEAVAQDIDRDFLRELAILRARVDEGVEQYGLGVKARIDEIMHFLAGTGASDARHMLLEPRIQVKMIQRMKKLGQKPQRGRVKDLKRIQDLVDALMETMQGSD